jgi:hypothetical protein
MTKFRVIIQNVRCQNIKSGDIGGTSDPFIKGRFDQDYRTFKTPVIRGSMYRCCIIINAFIATNPDWGSWNVDFIYETSYPQKLHVKFLKMDLYDYDRFKWNDYLGSVEVDLHTLGTGPVHHELSIKKDGQVQGTMIFDCIFEAINEVKIVFEDVKVTNLNFAGDPPTTYFTYSILHKNKWFTSSKAEKTFLPTWNEMGTVYNETTWRDFINEGIELKFKRDKFGFDETLGTATLYFHKYIVFKNGEKIEFKEDLRMDDKIAGTVSGYLVFTNLPHYAQMTEGTHTDNGIIDGVMLLDQLPKPKNWVPTSSKKSTEQTLIASQRSSDSNLNSSIHQQQYNNQTNMSQQMSQHFIQTNVSMPSVNVQNAQYQGHYPQPPQVQSNYPNWNAF